MNMASISITTESWVFTHRTATFLFKQWVTSLLLVRNLVTESEIFYIVRSVPSSLNVFLQKHYNSVLKLTFSSHASVHRQHASGQALHTLNSKTNTFK
jgi:hypothetical protein